MGLFERFRRWWRRNVVVDARNRVMFYKILEAQTRAGIRPLSICQNLASQKKLDKGIVDLAKHGEKAASGGRLASEGFDEGGYLPSEDVGVLQVAEQNDSLMDALPDLTDDAHVSRNLWNGVVRPAIFQVLPLVLALTMAIAMPDLLGNLVKDTSMTSNIPVIAFSTFMQDWGIALGALVLCLGVLITYGRPRWRGSMRRWLFVFDKDWRDQIAIQYCRLARSMSKQGATGLQTLDAFATVNRTPFVRLMLTDVRRDLQAGRSYAASLSGRLLEEGSAAMLDSLAPGENREQYPTAFELVGDMLEIQLTNTYSRAATTFRLLLMASSALLLILMLHGMFQIGQIVASQNF